MHVHAYVYVCMCVCVCERASVICLFARERERCEQNKIYCVSLEFLSRMGLEATMNLCC